MTDVLEPTTAASTCPVADCDNPVDAAAGRCWIHKPIEPIDLEEPEDETGLIHNGRYRIYADPADTKPKLHTRATTWAGALDDTTRLDAWRARMIAVGLSERPDLVEYFIATPEDDKDKLDELVEEAIKAAKGDARANRGSAAHGFLARILAGETVNVPTSIRQDVETALACLRRHGLTPLGDTIEAVLVCPLIGVAGSCDMLCANRDGELVVVDWKTGDKLVEYGPLKTSIQLAVYANATTIYDPTTKTHRPMPTVRQDVAYVVHRPLGTDVCQLIKVDIASGWKYASQLVRLVKDAQNHGKRKSDSLFEIVPDPDEEIVTGPTPICDVLPVAVAGLAASAVTPGFRDVVIRRINDLRINNVKAAQLLRDRWPAGVPGIKTDHVHTDIELQRIVGALEAAEIEASKTDELDEGRRMEDEDVAAVIKRFEALDAEKRAVLNGWAKEAKEAGVTFNLRLVPSQRRFEIYRACLRLVDLVDDDLDLCRATVAAVIPTAAFPTVAIGHALGSLTIAEAERLSEVAVDARNGNLTLRYDDAGKPHWFPPQIPSGEIGVNDTNATTSETSSETNEKDDDF